MSYKRTDSLNIPEDSSQHPSRQTIFPETNQLPNLNPNHSKVANSTEQMQEFQLQNLSASKKIPMALLLFVRSRKPQESLSASKTKSIMKQSKMAKAISAKLKSIKVCQICQQEIRDKKKISMTDCEHKLDFCESCLHHYVIFKVKNFQEVECPQDQCKAVLDTKSQFFSSLPLNVQKNYIKIHQFQITSKDPSLRMCPKQKCQGLIKINEEDQFLTCQQCRSQFCKKCFFDKHKGDCSRNQLNFLQNNLHYRQCKKCKMVIEKNQGCNHMTCKCGHQFCYICGGKWPHRNGCQRIPGPDEDQPVNQYECCGCQINCRGIFCRILCFPLKILLFLLVTVLFLLIFAVKDVIVILGSLLISLFAGLFGLSLQFLCEQEGPIVILLIIGFPICIIVGIGKAMAQIFCEIVPDLLSQTAEGYAEVMTNVWRIDFYEDCCD